MRNKILCGMLVAACVAGLGQSAFSANETAEPTVAGIPRSEYVKAQGAMTEAFATKEIVAINAQIDKLIDQRDELVFAQAAKLHPELATQIKAVADGIRAQKKNRAAPGS